MLDSWSQYVTSSGMNSQRGPPSDEIARSTKLIDLSHIHRAKQRFTGAGLVLPPIPANLAPRLKERAEWRFSTKPLTLSPYAFEEYVRDGTRKGVRDSLVLAHAGHGVNSYALHYYLAQKPLRLFLQVGWGGAYMDEVKEREEINCCFSLAHTLVAAVAKAKLAGSFRPGDRLIVAASDLYGGYWCKPGEEPPSERLREVQPRPVHEILTDVQRWVVQSLNR